MFSYKRGKKRARVVKTKFDEFILFWEEISYKIMQSLF